jgi:hypothetical protein
MPVKHPRVSHVMGENNKKVTAEADELFKFLVEKNILRLYAGHVHYSGSYEMEGMETVLVGAVTKTRNTQAARWTEVEGDKNEVVLIND